MREGVAGGRGLTSGTAAVVTTAWFAALAGCQEPEGPAEKAGQAIDKAVEKSGEKIEKTGENLQDAARRDEKK